MAAIRAWNVRRPVRRNGSFAFHPFSKQLVAGAVPDQNFRLVHLYVAFWKVNLRIPGQLHDVVRSVEESSVAARGPSGVGNDDVFLGHRLSHRVRAREEIRRDLIRAETRTDWLVRATPPF